ncbi:MAG: tRNA1(Val) (adenine(37)-N6)-methyltransferase [Bauldia sp.]|jgi:tRNA1(Val) A37 N6-methylase TrmN6
MNAAGSGTTTVDAFLGGRVEAVQPAAGHHRSGLEAVLLAAALAPNAAGRVIDLGAGAGVAGLCAAARAPGITVTLVEREEELLAAARAGLARPANAAFADRIALARLDIATDGEAVRSAAGVDREAAAIVLTNPPFRPEGAVRVSPQPARAAAHVATGGLDPWFRFAAWALQPGGALVAILPAASLYEALDGLSGRFGAVTALPVHPRRDEPALRILLAARKGSRAPFALLPGFVLHDGPHFTAEAEAVFRGAAGLSEVHPAWRAVA